MGLTPTARYHPYRGGRDRPRACSDGEALVQTAAHEIGNGVYTVLAQSPPNA